MKPKRPTRRLGDLSLRRRSVGHRQALAQRLADDLAASTEAYRHQLALDLRIVDGLLRAGETDGAAGALEDHRRALHGFAADVQDAVEDATD